MTETPTEGRKRDQYVPLWITQAGSDAIDEARGTWTRSEYIRQALTLAAREKLRGPKPGKF